MEEENATGASATESQVTTENKAQSTTELNYQITNSSIPQAEIITTQEGTTATTTTTTVTMTSSPAVATTTTVVPVTVAGATQNVPQADYTGQIRITNEAWNNALLDSSSDEYQNLQNQILQLVS